MLLALTMMAAPAHAEVLCGTAAGAAAGFIDIRDNWELAGQGPLLPTASPILSLGCQTRPDFRLSADLAPWYVHFNTNVDREIRQWWTVTLHWSPIAVGSVQLGPAASAGNSTASWGLAGVLPLGADHRELTVRMLHYPTDPLLNAQLQVLCTLFRRPV